MENMVALSRSFGISEMTLKSYVETSVIPFKYRKSIRKRNFLSFFGAMMIGEEYAEKNLNDAAH
jgi:hypothetical protein